MSYVSSEEAKTMLVWASSPPNALDFKKPSAHKPTQPLGGWGNKAGSGKSKQAKPDEMVLTLYTEE